ncbi:MAG: tRNA (adenosine(37)-N6)-threonylcarbamoyltransferase complex dimerization subunit type 1 TsaB [Gemmatimonadaceae bacterium]
MNPSFPSPLLVVEASSSAGSVALFVDGEFVSDRQVAMGPSREDAILPAIADVLGAARISPKDVRAIACGSGPGSFTSLRIAASLAKGMVVANDAELFAVPSMLFAAAELIGKPGNYVLHSDALRGERYVVRAEVSEAGSLIVSNTARLTLADTISLATDAQSMLVCVGASATSEHDVFVLQPQARNVAHLRELWHTFGPVSVESWEPDYGRLAEAQVKWESTHGRALPAS